MKIHVFEVLPAACRIALQHLLESGKLEFGKLTVTQAREQVLQVPMVVGEHDSTSPVAQRALRRIAQTLYAVENYIEWR